MGFQQILGQTGPGPGAWRGKTARGLLAIVGGVGLLLLAGCFPKTPEAEGEAGTQEPLGQNVIQISWADQNMAKINRIYGYNVYRSDSPGNGFVKANSDLIVPTPEDPNPAFVKFVDRGLPMNKIYYYYVEAVLQDGSRQKATEVAAQRVTKAMTAEEIKKWRGEQAKGAKTAK